MKIFSKKPKNTIIKLYALNVPYKDRENVVNTSVLVCEKFFQKKPNEYVIHGPYGISKGRSVGYKSFINKLTKKGHEKYYAINGNYKEEFGFHLIWLHENEVLELTYWFINESLQINEFELVQDLVIAINVLYGYIFTLPVNYMVSTESRVRKSLLGGLSVSNNLEYSKWLHDVLILLKQGKIRDYFPVNIVNSSQIAFFDHNLYAVQPLPRGLSYLQHRST